MEHFVCHDLKTQAREVSGGLPGYLKLVPVLFFFAVVFGTASMGWFKMGTRKAEAEVTKWQSETTKFQAESARVGREQRGLEELNVRATEVAAWVEGAHNIQPLCLAIARGAGDESSVAELVMSRNSEIPSQVHLTLKMNQVNAEVMDNTLLGIRSLNFRAYSAQQQKNHDELDYKATLVWQDPSPSGR